MVTDSYGTELQHATCEGVTYVAAEADQTFQVQVRNLQSVVPEAKAFVSFDGADMNTTGHVKKNGWCTIQGFWEKTTGTRAFVFAPPKSVTSSDAKDVAFSLPDSKYLAAQSVGQIKVSIRPSKWVPCLGNLCHCRSNFQSFSQKHGHPKNVETVTSVTDEKFYMLPSLSVRAGQNIPEDNFFKAKRENQEKKFRKKKKEHLRQDKSFEELSVFFRCETFETLRLRNIFPGSEKFSGQDKKKPILKEEESTKKKECCTGSSEKENYFFEETQKKKCKMTEINTNFSNIQIKVDPVTKFSPSFKEKKNVLETARSEKLGKRAKIDKIIKEMEKIHEKMTEKGESKFVKMEKKEESNRGKSGKDKKLAIFIDLSKEDDYSSEILMWEYLKKSKEEVVTI